MKLLANRTIQNMAMIEGLVYVTNNLEWYLSISALTFADPPNASEKDITHLRESLKSKVTQLLQSLLEYQMKSVCYCGDEHQIAQFLRSMLAIDDWKHRLDTLKELENDINRYINQFHGTYGATMLRQMDGLRAQLDGLAKNLQSADTRRSAIAGRISMIQRRLGPTKSWELVAARRATGFGHISREADVSAPSWTPPAEGGLEMEDITGLSLIQSNIGDPGNLELACVADGALHFFWQDPAYHDGWVGPHTIWTHPKCTGNPALIQGNFYNRGNFELVVPSVDRGLLHYHRNNDDPSLPWHNDVWFGQNLRAVSSVSMIQSNYGSEHGNLEVICVADGRLYSFYRDNGSLPYEWHGPHVIHPEVKVAGNPALIQSQAGEKGNFELVVPSADGGLLHI